MGKQQRIVRFHGTVQGVGFRYAALRTAQAHAVTGTVRNMPDGTVECVVEGEAGEVDAFVDDLRERISPYVRKVDQQAAPYSGAFGGFGITH